MKLWTPEISWHEKLRILSLDLYPKPIKCGESIVWKLATAGADNDVKIWHVTVPGRSLEFRASLDRHSNAVNVVRFSPSGEFLASGSDDCSIMLWRFSEDKPVQKQTLKDDCEPNKENWSAVKILGGHAVGVYDISWSPDSNFMISGAIDNRAIVWDVKKGKTLLTFCESDSYVQGVAWDPRQQYVATLSNDSSCRIYSLISKQNLIHQISKCNLGRENFDEKLLKMSFEGSTLGSFFRRLTFSPDGLLLIVPSGKIEKDGSSFNATFVFNRASLSRPAVYLPSPGKSTIAVRCCPVFFQLRQKDVSDNCKTLFKLPYRMVFAVATLETVLLYDTQQTLPIAMIGKIHYAPLTDLTWSTNGQLLVVSSSDGYCSLIEFADGELGVPLTPTELQQINSNTTISAPANACNPVSQQTSGMKLEKSVLATNATQAYPHVVATAIPGAATSAQRAPTMKSSDHAACGVTLNEPYVKRVIQESTMPVSMVTLLPPIGHTPTQPTHVSVVTLLPPTSYTHTQPTNQLSSLQVSDHDVYTIPIKTELPQPMPTPGWHTPNSQQPANMGNATPDSGGQLKPRRLPLSALKAV